MDISVGSVTNIRYARLLSGFPEFFFISFQQYMIMERLYPQSGCKKEGRFGCCLLLMHCTWKLNFLGCRHDTGGREGGLVGVGGEPSVVVHVKWEFFSCAKFSPQPLHMKFILYYEQTWVHFKHRSDVCHRCHGWYLWRKIGHVSLPDIFLHLTCVDF